MIDSLTSTSFYVEKQSLITITCNSKKNNEGIIKTDDYENSLVSLIDSGDTPLYRLKSYNGENKVMLYNSATKYIQLVSSNEFIHMNLDFIKGLNYYIGAKRIISSNYNSNNYTFTIALDGLNIFKIFLDNGIELKNYDIKINSRSVKRNEINSNTNLEYNTYADIQIKGLDRQFLDDFSEIIVFAYRDNKIIDDTEFIIEYYGYPTIYEYTSFIDQTYFETFNGEELTSFDSFNINQNVTKTTIKRNFGNIPKTIINSIENSGDIETFLISDETDVIQYLGNNVFRCILINPVFGRVVLINNCTLFDNGVSLNYQKEKNTRKLSISCGNYIDINMSNSNAYGEDKYGKGQYGTGTWVTNSARRGEK